MISKESFTTDWTKQFKKEKRFSKIDPTLLNKMIHAFALLESLKTNGLNFIFKGGTSLVLLLKEPKRFSIDIDIITESTKEELEKILDKVIESNTFIKYEPDKRKSGVGIPKAHYKFYFESDFLKGQAYVLLDVLFDENKYPSVSEISIASSWIKNEGDPEKVFIPTVESIIGDKMTAFAPNTTGIPYNKGKNLEIIKQLYDIGNLFDLVEDIKTVFESFKSNAENEIKFRKLEIDITGVSDDIIKTSLLLSKKGAVKDGDNGKKFKELLDGVKKIKNFLINDNFRIDEAVEAAAKASYLAAKLKFGKLSKIEFYSPDINIKDSIIEHPDYTFLNKLKKLPNTSFYYWFKTVELLTK